jgi:hydroxypyruvate isomerase
MDRRTFLEAGVGVAALAGQGLGEARDVAGGLKLRYAINIGTHFTGHPVLERLKLVADAGFSAVEFNGLPQLQRDKGSAEPNYRAIEEYGEALRHYKLAQATWVTNPCAGACDASLVDPAGHASFLRGVEVSTRVRPMVDGTISTVTSGVEMPSMSREAMTANVIEALKRGAEIVEKAGGPILVLEPLNVLVDHPGYHVVRSDHAAEIIDAVGSSKVKICFDIYHQQISEGNLIGNVRKHYDRIGYFQFGDHPGRHEPFTGEIYYPRVFQAIHALGYKGLVGGEYGPAGGGSDQGSTASLDAVRRADAW